MIKYSPVKEKEKILLTIKRIGINGEGIGFYKRQAVFVDDAIVGEEVEVEITQVLDGYSIGTVTKRKVTSPNRANPKCKYYGKCGGCQLCHMNYETTLVEKQNLVLEAFDRYYDGTLDDVIINPTIGMDNPYRYRNKASLPIRHDGEKVVRGMYAKNSNKLVYVENCLIESPLITKVIDSTLDCLTKAKVDCYNPKSKLGHVRYIVVRGFEETNEVQVTLITRKMEQKQEKAMELISKIENVKSVNYSINEDVKAVEIFGNEVVNTHGAKEIKGKLGKLNFLISPKAFFQLNTKQTTVLYDEVKKACELTGKENVLDCYCGIGSIGLYIADKCKEVRGIDINKDGIKDAIKFSKMNNINNARFYAGNILPHFHNFNKEGFSPDVLVCDPPRKGMDLNFINFIKKAKIKRIVYVSCNPATLAKNCNHLQKEYRIESLQPVDMFPYTSGVECVCTLVLK